MDDQGQPCRPDPGLAARLEAELHNLLKRDHPGRFFDFAGMVLFVTGQTDPGRVDHAELIVL